MYNVTVTIDGVVHYVRPYEDGTFGLTRRDTISMNYDMAAIAEEWVVTTYLQPGLIHRVS